MSSASWYWRATCCWHRACAMEGRTPMADDSHPGDLTPPGLSFAFRILLQFEAGPRLRFEPAHRAGRRGHVAVKGGEISGPRLQGRVVPMSGGDWPLFWPGGLVDFEAHYQLEASA